MGRTETGNRPAGIDDVGAVFATHQSQSEIDLTERFAQERLLAVKKQRSTQFEKESLLHELLDCTQDINDAAAAIVDDTFTKCFKSNEPDPWNWNAYLFPLWCCGCAIRYGILFPIRLLLLLLGFLIFFLIFFPVHYLLPDKWRIPGERLLIEFLASAFVISWTGVIRYHGPRPSVRTNQVFVANHTSMIDFIILEQTTPFAVIMQKHGGWVGWMQSTVLSSLGCIHFNRSESKDRALVAQKIKEHATTPGRNPLLIFPEGCCVNNEYCVMFKRGAFDLGVTVCPIAIKYNKIFVDAFWNSRRESFSGHLFRLMTSWAVVADVWFMESQTQRQGETSEQFAERVRDLISSRAGLKTIPWDGLLKYYRPSAAMCERQRQAFADRMKRHLEGSATPRFKDPSFASLGGLGSMREDSDGDIGKGERVGEAGSVRARKGKLFPGKLNPSQSDDPIFLLIEDPDVVVDGGDRGCEEETANKRVAELK